MSASRAGRRVGSEAVPGGASRDGATLARLEALIDVLPVGVIIVDEANRVVRWNARAEHFIECVGRPALRAGMTLEETHTGKYRAPMEATVRRLAAGEPVPCKRVDSARGCFRVSYNALHDDSDTYVGVAQVIEFLHEEEAR